MSGSFLDTTIVINIASKVEPGKTKGEGYIKANQPAEAPYYALRELLAGYIQNLCNVHNIVLASENIAEAVLALSKISSLAGRKKDTQIQSFSAELIEVFRENPTGSRNDVKREMLQGLMLKTVGCWRRANAIMSVNNVQPLSCFTQGKIDIDSAGALRGPNNSFNCIKSERCAAAAYLYDNQNDLQKLIDALHPNNLPPSVANKNENQQRRKALMELKTKGPKEFSKGRCRALGDAYFAAMCPSDSVVVTSNIKDFEPLCLALSKEVVEP